MKFICYLRSFDTIPKWLFTFVALLFAGCGEKTHYSPPLTEEEVKIIAEAIDVNTLQKRGKDGEALYYAPNEQTPYTGWVKWMHDNGQIDSLGQAKDGKLHGLWTSWYVNGQKMIDGNYKDGKEDGFWTDWYENGQKKAEGNYKDGIPDGLRTKWYPDGQKREEANWKDGKPLSAVVWKPNGEKCPDTNWVKGNGVYVQYNDDGTEAYRIRPEHGEDETSPTAPPEAVAPR